METLNLHPDRFFGPDENVRRIARDLFAEVEHLPLICPHGHVPPQLLADDRAFPEPTSLIITPDHYIFRMLHSQGISLDALGIPGREGSRPDGDPRAIWKIFAEHYHLFLGTPTRVWLDYVLYHLFDVRMKLSGASAMRIYDQIQERLAEPSFRPRALFDRFNIEVLTTTDAAADSLEHHRRIRESDWDGQVVPCFRPDAVFQIAAPDWPRRIAALAAAADTDIASYGDFIAALESRRAFFREMGATSTDHAVLQPLTHRLPDAEAERLFDEALQGRARLEGQQAFEAHMLMEMARMSVEDGLVMQIHAGAYRNHDRELFARYGPDKGGDIPVQTEYTRNLQQLLNGYGNESSFTLVVFTLDEATYARELAPLAGHYPAMKIGPAWWFHDSIEGMRRYKEALVETAGVYNLSGFNDDTRAFLSIPARHDLARRIDANYVATLVARHQIDRADARSMMQALSYDLAKSTYRFDRAKHVSVE
ncbi:MAG: glucuronate isomerase [Bacteroidota bacterium]